MIMFKLIQTGGPYSDQTWSYHVRLNGEYTVKTFIQAVLTNSREWGYIGIYDGKSIFGNPSVKYRNDTITGEMPDEYLNLKVVSARASGGWSRMDYLLFL